MIPGHNTGNQIKEAIDSNLLLLWGGALKHYDKDEYIFHEGQQPHFYHQIIEGRIKMLNEMDDGKGFIQGFFSSGQSFGEPPIFDEAEYPASAIAVVPTVIIRLSISSFKRLLKENFDVHWQITKLLCRRIIGKARTLKGMTYLNPEERIINVLDKFKKEIVSPAAATNKVRVDYTRKQIADMTGLRVETVIRVMRNLYQRNILTIKKGKVYY